MYFGLKMSERTHHCPYPICYLPEIRVFIDTGLQSKHYSACGVMCKRCIFVPRAHDPFGLHQGLSSRSLAQTKRIGFLL